MWSLLCFAVLCALIRPSYANTRPTFVKDVITQLQREGIAESTPMGKEVGQISCVDADGDKIIYVSFDTKYLDVQRETGIVYVSGVLDAEEFEGTRSEPVKVRFQCIDLKPDGTFKSEGSIVDIGINILDINDEIPTFSTDSKMGFTYMISESAPNGTELIGTITITDKDIEENALIQKVAISCDPGQPIPCTPFRLTSKQVDGEQGMYTVNLFLNGTLDYEKVPVYSIQVTAVDGVGTTVHNTGSVGLRIVVLDSQDTDPQFENPVFNFAINEGTPENTRVNFALSARDMDSGSVRDIKLEILNRTDGPNYFRAGDSVKGDRGIFSAPVIVTSVIDRESGDSVYRFTAKATELFQNNSRTTATVTAVFTVIIKDINDNAPLFTQRVYNKSVPEVDSGVILSSITVPQLKVVDRDEGDNAKYRVRVLDQSFSGAFDVTPKTEVSGSQVFYLQINNFRYLDYENENYQKQFVTLQAIETRTREQLNSTATVYITITDKNDHKPEFAQDRYEESVSENVPLFTTILTLNATDKDTGRDGQVYYKISDNFGSTFQVNSQTGAIVLIKKLNYEAKRTYEFLAYAVDNSTDPKTSNVLVVIRVTDYNENGPQFTSTQYKGLVTETRLDFLDPVRVEAVDPSDTQANITYRIVSGNTPTNSFVLNPITGELSLRELVSFEKTPNRSGFFNLEVEATDNSEPPLSARTIVVVQVNDENNQKPIFNPVIYTLTISEAIAPGTPLLNVSATDADQGSNGQVSYRIGRGGRDSFVVTESGQVYISGSPTFDYDLYQTLTMQIIATDGGSPQYSATATMSVTITDANNKPPSFIQKSYNKIIDEALPKGSEVLQVSATDPDKNNSLRYTLLKSTVSALNKAGAIVQSDAYDITQVFEMDPVTGRITLSPAGPGLDRNFMAEATFQVLVQDSFLANQTDRAFVFIVITGRTETELYFIRPWTKSKPEYRMLISESTSLGQEIKTVQARDPVDGSLVTRYEEVPNTDAGNYFTVDGPTGKITLNRRLDYESGLLSHSVVVRAIKDQTSEYGPRTVTATIFVQVQDVNDNAPQFTKQDYTFRVKESAPLNYRVGDITAYDNDGPSSGPIDFIMGVGQDRNDFILFQAVGSNTAEIRVNRKLDFERRSSYLIEVIARDNINNTRGSNLPLQSKAKVKIFITDENDNRPTFTDKTRTFSVPETAELDTTLGQVLARDDDNGLNGDIDYSLQRNNQSPNIVNPLNLFGITEVSGILVTKQSLRGLSGEYSLLVTARDKGAPRLSSSIPIIIKVQGVEDDDGTPKWVSPVRFQTFVAEHNQTKLDIRLMATPRSTNGHIIYSLIPLLNNDQVNFRIDARSGDIFVIADLDREIQATYTLLVEAKDSANVSLVSRRQLFVHLIDVNDNDPSFKKSRYSSCPTDFEVPTEFSVVDDTPRGVIVAQASACDADGAGHNQMFYYRFTDNKLCRENQDSALKVNPNGSIESTTVLDFEQKEDYLVCVEVRGSPKTTGGRRRRATYNVSEMIDTDKIGYIVVKIIDRNDNGPTFPKDDVIGVLETVPSEDTVHQVVATDPDGPLNNRVIYAIKSIMYYPPDGKAPFPMRGAFNVNPDNGVISTNLPSYKDFAQGNFQLEIEAFDVKNRLLNDSKIVTLVVYQRSQILRVVLNKPPGQGQQLANDLIKELNKEGKKDGKQFFFIKVSEHRTGNTIVVSQTDVCFVMVENKLSSDARTGLDVLDSAGYKSALTNFQTVDTGTCYTLLSTEDKVRWRNLWWVLVVIAIFIFVCAIILLVTVCILYDRYKNYMDTQRTYLVPQ